MAKNNNNNSDVDLQVLALNKVKDSLESAIDDAIKTKDLNALSVRMQNMILLRTKRGYYLDGSGGKEKRKYQSESWKQKRAGRGLPTNRVTLFFGGGYGGDDEDQHDGGLLEAMVARGKMSLGKPTIEVGYFAGLSESKAMEIAKYMNDEGIGVNNVLYPYVGLTDDETDTAVDYLRGRIGGNLQRQFS